MRWGRGCSLVGTDPWIATTVKLACDFMIAAALESLSEAFALVRKSGVDASQFLDIINNALFNSTLYGNLRDRRSSVVNRYSSSCRRDGFGHTISRPSTDRLLRQLRVGGAIPATRPPGYPPLHACSSAAPMIFCARAWVSRKIMHRWLRWIA